MPRPYPGTSPLTTVTAAGTISYAALPGQYLHITEIDVGADSTFQSNGTLLATIGNAAGGGGVIVLGAKDTGAAVSLVLPALSIPYAPPYELIVEPNEVLTFFYGISSGTGKLQTNVIAQTFSTEEHNQWLKNQSWYLGGAYK